ncbi:MAG: hypothetical protein ACLVHV_13245 [Oscillospiraceae bacterium]
MKQLRILLGIALIFLLLSGCTRNHRASTDDRAATSGEETVAGEETTEPTLEPNELSGEDFCFASEIPGLNTLLRIREDRCLALFRQGDGTRSLFLYDLTTGLLLGDQVLDGGEYQAEILPDGSILLLNTESGEVRQYDAALEQCMWSRSFQGKQWLLLDTGTLLRTWDDGIFRVDLLQDGSPETEYPMEGQNDLVFSFAQGDRVLVQSEESLFWLDLESKLSSYPRQSAPDHFAQIGQPWAYHSSSEELVIWPIGEDHIYFFERPGKLYGSGGGTGKSSSAECRYRDHRGMGLGGRNLLGGDSGALSICCMGRKWICLHDLSPGNSSLSYQRCSAGDAQTGDCTAVTEEELQAQNQADADKLEEQTGMELRIGPAGNAFPDVGYYGMAEENPMQIHTALDAVNRFVNACPEGFFQELPTESVPQLRLYLCGPVMASMPDVPLEAGGFTTTVPNVAAEVLQEFSEQPLETELPSWQIIVLNIDYLNTVTDLQFEQILAHEFMHVMENRIAVCEEERNMPYLDYWYTFVPGLDAYYECYLDENGENIQDVTYTMAGCNSRSDRDDVWFTDSYARTFPTEDRARIMEVAYSNGSTEYATVFQFPHLMEKAQYLCAVIRECFPSCAQAEELPWEQLIETVPFESYRQAVQDCRLEDFG